MSLDPLLIGLGIVLVAAIVLIGSRFFPEDMSFSLWRYGGSRDRPSPGVREDDDQRFDWGSGERDDDEEG